MQEPAGEDVRGSIDEEVRFVTYLSPSIPRGLFEAVVDHVQRALGRERVSLRVETQTSGPKWGDERLFSAGGADVAFMCAPSFVWLCELREPPAELLGVLPVFEDHRNQGRPVYFCDLIVRNDAPIRSFAELRGSSWAYNDAYSLSGYFSVLKRLTECGADEAFFESISCSGSHLDSIEAVLRGEADAAAIDSNVLRIRFREAPVLRERLRVIETWGPFPIQPVVVRSALDPGLKERLRTAFLATQEDDSTRKILNRFGLTRFVAASQEDYSLKAHKDLAKVLGRAYNLKS
jgi:phosphonate transport system substrate-binding protein